MEIRKFKVLLVVAGLFLSSVAWGLSIPDRPEGRVHDAAGLLAVQEKSLIESRLAQIENETSNQIAVATFPSLDGEALEDFSIRLVEKWRLGQKGRDNGILLLIFPNDRRVRIEVGYGLEAVVPDAYASRLIEEKIKPAFRRGDFYRGIDETIEGLAQATQGVYEPIPKRRSRVSLGSGFLFLIFVFFAIAMNFLSALRRHGVIPGGTTYGTQSWGHGARWGSSGGSGWGGGGFGGGGGSFGGGGSSGSW